MAHRRPGAGEPITALQLLQERLAAKRVLLERIGRAHDAGELGEVDRLWAEVFALE